jgi:GNAT superfamily N-acetyltransferase
MVRLVAGARDTEAAARIRTAVWRWIATEPETIVHYRSTWPGFRDWLALLDGKPVGIGACGLIPGEEESAAAFGLNSVLREARRQGVGTAIYRQVSEHARSLGKSELQTWGFEDDLDGVTFAEHHGFIVIGRTRGLRVVLDGCPRPSIDLPQDITMTTLAERPDLARGAWETTCEAMADIPYDGDAPMSPGSFAEFEARALTGPKYIPEATFVAVHGGEVVGYGRLGWMDRAAGIGDHQMLAVRRYWRGRGIARALKAAQIGWALDNGLTELRTGNEERNTVARAVNANFPYVPLPDQLLYRGPLDGASYLGRWEM